VRTHSAGGWVGSGADMNGFGEKKISCSSQDSNPGLSSPQLIAILPALLSDYNIIFQRTSVFHIYTLHTHTHTHTYTQSLK